MEPYHYSQITRLIRLRRTFSLCVATGNKRAKSTQELLNVCMCSITCRKRQELNRIIKLKSGGWTHSVTTSLPLLLGSLCTVHLHWFHVSGSGRGEVFYDFKVQIGLSLPPSHTYTHADSLAYLPQRVWQIYVLSIRHLLMVKNEFYWMSYKMLAGQRVHKSWTRPCHTAQPSLLLLINSNLPTLCLMQCGSGWPVHCRPLPSVLHSRFNPHFRRPQSGLKATLTPAGHQWYFNLKPPLSPLTHAVILTLEWW